MKIKRLISLVAVLCVLFCALAAGAEARDTSAEETTAAALKSLGLFRGVSDTNFDLNRAPTRVEALVMLIRTLGKESEALGGNWTHPFTDVPSWADPYVGYAYENGLTKGVSATSFGSGPASAAMYVTFVLRALNYSDANGDFSWNDPFTLARGIGILPGTVNLNEFWRADVALVSFAALTANLKDTNTTLAEQLVSVGTFTWEQYESATMLVNPGSSPTVVSLEVAEDLIPPAEVNRSTVEETETENEYSYIKWENTYLGEWYPGISEWYFDGNATYHVYVVNRKTGKIHCFGCDAIDDMDDENKAVTIDPEGLIFSDKKYSYCLKDYCKKTRIYY